jgi:ring-1,2-phenylacetyl-CoA epoxidase subunit PaaE
MSAAFHTLTIERVTRETADAVAISFAVPEDLRAAFAFKPGQHLTLRAEIDGEDVRRNYSICVAPSEGTLRVAIKAIEGGVFSNWAACNIKPGDLIEALPPHGSFTIDFDPARVAHYVGFAGGSGITPILSILKSALDNEPQSRFTLFYGNRDSASVIFLEELAELKNRYMGRFQLFHFLAEEEEDIALFNGRLDAEKCREIVDTMIDPNSIRDFFICGPGPMMDAAEAALQARGVTAAKIHIERFTAGRPSAAQAEMLAAQVDKAAGARMRITLDGRTRTISFDSTAGNILDSARAGGMPAPYACKAGVCATCRAKVISGSVTMAARYGLTDEEVAAGYVLTCQSIPDGDAIALDYDG